MNTDRLSKFTRRLTHSRRLPDGITARLNRLIQAPLFPRTYLVTAGAVLLLSTIFWSVLDARLQNNNADEGVNAFLFHSPAALSHDNLPAAHSFILKWPLFFLLRVFSDPRIGLTALTVLVTILTVGGFAWILSRFERRPVVLGTLWLLLALALMLIPPLPYGGSFLPVNMAMLATRNIEYIWYIAALWLMIRFCRFSDWRFWAGAALMAVLIASDKLFLALSIGSALGVLAVQAVTKNSGAVRHRVKLLLGAVIAAAAADVCLALLSVWHVTRIAGGGETGPYMLSLSPHGILLGIVYAISSLATNVGANPAFQTTVLARMPSQAISNLWGWAGPALIINMIVWIIGCWLVVRFLLDALKGRSSEQSNTVSVTTIHVLVWSLIVALAAFIFSDHYYAGDARYLSIGTFALFMIIAFYARQREWRRTNVIMVGLVVLIASVLAIPAVLNRYDHNQTVLANVEHRNDTVAAIMSLHSSYVLVGDYWRVVPIKLRQTSLNIMPMQKCTDFRSILAQNSWEHDLSRTNFAYLYTSGQHLIGLSPCSLQTIERTYGEPDNTTIVSGSASKPKEILLFYNHGSF